MAAKFGFSPSICYATLLTRLLWVSTTPFASLVVPDENGSATVSSTEISSSGTERGTASAAHIFKSKLPDIALPNDLLLHTYCFLKLPEIADRPCLITSDKTYTYGHTHLLTRKVAAGISKLGVLKGDVIIILFPNSPEFVFSFMAASMLGAVATTANPFYTAAKISKQLAAAKPKLAVTLATHVHKLDLDSDLEVVVMVDDLLENCVSFAKVSAAEESEVPAEDISAEDAVALPFSSGMTGLTKGVVLNHKSLVNNVAQQMKGENPNLAAIYRAVL
ncbi:hypothetical protein Fmac_020866 [Flemingia macrophylla]|uniref:AMP-dependent synthetase/ligase domain-containing protein n=1 Tax=Flemingia macrophylla TaxID=520843 RepID=A0ABD1LV73_9FABA